jgi:hypothetical protein
MGQGIRVPTHQLLARQHSLMIKEWRKNSAVANMAAYRVVADHLVACGARVSHRKGWYRRQMPRPLGFGA